MEIVLAKATLEVWSLVVVAILGLPVQNKWISLISKSQMSTKTLKYAEVELFVLEFVI